MFSQSLPSSEASKQDKPQQWQAIAQLAWEKFAPPGVLGLGTGRTVEALIDHIHALGQEPRSIVVSSLRTQRYCQALGWRVSLPYEVAKIECYFDGADVIDKDFISLKGGGAAMTGEALCARMADQFVMLVDESKWRDKLEGILVIEVIPWAVSAVSRAMVAIGGQPQLRIGVTTDHGNPIIDVSGLDMAAPYSLSDKVACLTGVVGHGLFAHQRPDQVVTVRHGRWAAEVFTRDN